MNVAIFNDTSSYHHIGCLAVSDAHDRMLVEAGAHVLYRHYVHELHDFWRGNEQATHDYIENSAIGAEVKAVDAVVINGEGSIHHSSGLHLLALLSYAQHLGKRTYLVNAVIQDIPLYHDTLRRLDDLTVREVFSFRYLAKLGVESRIVLDSIVGAGFTGGVDECYRNKIIVTDCHASRPDVQLILDKVADQFSSELVYFPLEDENCKNDWRDALKKIRAAKLVVTGRHHAVYLALLAKTPFIALPSNTWKIEGTLEQLNALHAMWAGTDIVEMVNAALKHPERYTSVFEHELLAQPLTTFARLGDKGLPKSLLDLDVYRYLASEYIRPLSAVLFIGSQRGLGVFKDYSLATRFSFCGVAWRQNPLPTDVGDFDTFALSTVDDVDSIVCIDVVVGEDVFEKIISVVLDKLRPGGRLIVRCSGGMKEHFFADDEDKNPASEKLVCAALLPESASLVKPILDGVEEWICIFFKNPLATHGVPYQETNLPEFNGKTHLVDFSKYYDNPWVVHAMVEIPWRIKNSKHLFDLAKQLLTQSKLESADYGAALAILGWRYYEDNAVDIQDTWHVDVGQYLAQDQSTNPHVRRWCVSLGYLQASFYQREGRLSEASACFQRVVDTEIICITPTLGTKQVNAALRAGVIYWELGECEKALDVWRKGMSLSFKCLSVDQIEFVGNNDAPFLHSMNDAVEILDAAVQCASALNIASRRGTASESIVLTGLVEVAQNALRSAFNKVSQELKTCKATSKNLEELLNATSNAKDYAEQLAFSRLDEINSYCRHNKLLIEQLDLMESAKAYAEELALSRLEESNSLKAEKAGGLLAAILSPRTAELEQEVGVLKNEVSRISSQLQQMEHAKQYAEGLAISRLAELEAQRVLHQEQLEALHNAKNYAEELALARLAELDSIRSTKGK